MDSGDGGGSDAADERGEGGESEVDNRDLSVRSPFARYADDDRTDRSGRGVDMKINLDGGGRLDCEGSN